MLPVAVAKGDFRATNWLADRQQQRLPNDLLRQGNVIMGGSNHKDKKPISICTTYER